MVVNEAFDAFAFLCIVLTGSAAIYGCLYLFYKYVLGRDFDSGY